MKSGIGVVVSAMPAAEGGRRTEESESESMSVGEDGMVMIIMLVMTARGAVDDGA